jgi:hypothetical protein
MPAYVKTRQKLTTIEGDDALVLVTSLRFEDLLERTNISRISGP